MAQDGRTTRRSFLRRAGWVAGGIVLAGAGVGVLGSRRPAVQLVSNSFGGASMMSAKVLVTYASRCGSTGEIAEEIGKVLASRGSAVDILPVRSVGDLSKYQAVVVGSPVHLGRWLPEARALLKTNQAALARVPTAVFTTHLLAGGDSADGQRRREAYAATLAGLISPRATAFLAGSMDVARLSLIDRLITRVVGAPEGDLRDWTAIARWAQGLTTALELDTGQEPG